MDKIIEVCVAFLSFCIMVLLIAFFLGAPVMWLWNWLMPVIFGLTRITFVQAIGLNVLMSVLFGHINIGGKN
jgi:hypothetical protein